MDDYFLVDTGTRMPRWCRLARAEAGGTVWVDPIGLLISRADGWALAHVQGEGHDAPLGAGPDIAATERRLAMVHLLDPWSDQGWLSPEGRFYGCRLGQHENLMHALLHRRVADAEAQGFVRVHEDSIRVSEFRRREALFTERQAEVLAVLGFAHLTPGLRREGRYAPDRALPPPRYAFRPPAGLALPPAVRTRPPAERRKPKGPPPWERVLERLRSADGIPDVFAGPAEHDKDFGGRWSWMLRFEGFDLGTEERAGDLARSPGLRLDATAFDQVEITGDDAPGIHVGESARAVFEAVARYAPAGP